MKIKQKIKNYIMYKEYLIESEMENEILSKLNEENELDQEYLQNILEDLECETHIEAVNEDESDVFMILEPENEESIYLYEEDDTLDQFLTENYSE